MFKFFPYSLNGFSGYSVGLRIFWSSAKYLEYLSFWLRYAHKKDVVLIIIPLPKVFGVPDSIE